ncbi:MAG TPA: MarR family transcriptional regulator [Acidobacteriaceae bacterium]
METYFCIPPPIPGLESHLGYWLRRVSNAVSGAFARSLHARRTSVAEWVVLRHLSESEQAPGELAEALTMTRGAISKIVDKLQAKGWIRSETNSDDNRRQILSLTALGRRTLPQLAQIADQNDELFFTCLSKGEQSELRRLLTKLAEHHHMRKAPVD